MSIADCLAKIAEYEKIKDQINGLSGYVSDCTTVIDKANEFSKEIIINKKTIDKGNLTIVSDYIKEITETLSPLVLECNEKIAYYQDLYNKLLIVETKKHTRGKMNYI